MPRRKHLLLVAGFVALTACSRPFSAAYTTQTTRAPARAGGSGAIAIGGAGFAVRAAGEVDRAAIDGAWAAVLDTLNRYLDTAVLTPLRSGGPAGDLAPLFTTVSVGRVAGPTATPDRYVFIDEGLPPAADVREVGGVATLTGLAGLDKALSVVSAELDLRLSGRINGAPFSLVRTGELVLLPEGGTWRIDAWDIKVTRTTAGVTTTSASHA